MVEIKTKHLFIYSTLLIAFLNLSCKRNLLPTGEYVDVTLKAVNFMYNCYSGNSTSGISTSHVNYLVTIEVDEYSNGQYLLANKNQYNSPITPDKSIFTQTIRVPNNKPYRILFTIDALECSICNQSGCTPISTATQWIGTGKPYWYGEFGFGSIPAGNLITVMPARYPRFLNQIPPTQCDCTIKK